MLAAAVVQISGLVPQVSLGGVLEFAQINLLSIWLAIGSRKQGAKWLQNSACFLTVVVAADGPRGMALFSTVPFDFMAQFVLLDLTMAVSVWLAAAAAVMAARKWWPKFDVVQSEPSAAPPVQFSIRSLLLLLFITAILLTIARGIRANFAAYDGSLLIFYWLTPMVAIYSGVATVICLFAGLGTSNLWLRTAVAVAVQLGLSLLMASSISRDWDGTRIVLQVTLQLAETFVILGSLWVVRSCGYRIVSRSPAGATFDASISPAPHPLD